VAALTAERDAARADADRERDHGNQRVDDLRTLYERQLDTFRTEIAEARAAGAESRSRRGGAAGRPGEGPNR
jgi:hypothetical protein